ncbi:uncharacterized protein TRIADDRAFT_52881 [Trichoplax adhaerens]|uniref:APAF-1 helical domain-containing protein n=1 Tax=Trichoplax adhaerens TaxID=10228 RepID=B3RMQ0_TRIAD|nr:predicted protein [Trichoplax adhaerens]EDV27314.1 predicted protein [Trichoplax adhaerens]|eukprot:XP_002109148.1 predicted protein [Trichoplax adhaerens]
MTTFKRPRLDGMTSASSLSYAKELDKCLSDYLQQIWERINACDETMKNHILQLSIFEKGIPIPLTTISTFWEMSEDLLFIQRCQVKCQQRWHTLTDDGYMHQQLVNHAIAANDFKTVNDLLTNLHWIEVKFKACHCLSDLLRDYDICEGRLDESDWLKMQPFAQLFRQYGSFLDIGKDDLIQFTLEHTADNELHHQAWQMAMERQAMKIGRTYFELKYQNEIRVKPPWEQCIHLPCTLNERLRLYIRCSNPEFGKLRMVTCTDREIYVTDFNKIVTFNAYRGCSAKISPNGKIIAYVWHIEKQVWLHFVRVTRKADKPSPFLKCNEIEFSPNDNDVIISWNGRKVQVWKLVDEIFHSDKTWIAHHNDILLCQFVEGGQKLITWCLFKQQYTPLNDPGQFIPKALGLSWNTELKVWSTENYRELQKIKLKYTLFRNQFVGLPTVLFQFECTKYVNNDLLLVDCSSSVSDHKYYTVPLHDYNDKNGIVIENCRPPSEYQCQYLDNMDKVSIFDNGKGLAGLYLQEIKIYLYERNGMVPYQTIDLGADILWRSFQFVPGADNRFIFADTERCYLVAIKDDKDPKQSNHSIPAVFGDVQCQRLEFIDGVIVCAKIISTTDGERFLQVYKGDDFQLIDQTILRHGRRADVGVNCHLFKDWNYVAIVYFIEQRQESRLYFSITLKDLDNLSEDMWTVHHKLKLDKFPEMHYYKYRKKDNRLIIYRSRTNIYALVWILNCSNGETLATFYMRSCDTMKIMHLFNRYLIAASAGGQIHTVWKLDSNSIEILEKIQPDLNDISLLSVSHVDITDTGPKVQTISVPKHNEYFDGWHIEFEKPMTKNGVEIYRVENDQRQLIQSMTNLSGQSLFIVRNGKDFTAYNSNNNLLMKVYRGKYCYPSQPLEYEVQLWSDNDHTLATYYDETIRLYTIEHEHWFHTIQSKELKDLKFIQISNEFSLWAYKTLCSCPYYIKPVLPSLAFRQQKVRFNEGDLINQGYSDEITTVADVHTSCQLEENAQSISKNTFQSQETAQDNQEDVPHQRPLLSGDNLKTFALEKTSELFVPFFQFEINYSMPVYWQKSNSKPENALDIEKKTVKTPFNFKPKKAAEIDWTTTMKQQFNSKPENELEIEEKKMEQLFNSKLRNEPKEDWLSNKPLQKSKEENTPEIEWKTLKQHEESVRKFDKNTTLRRNEGNETSVMKLLDLLDEEGEIPVDVLPLQTIFLISDEGKETLAENLPILTEEEKEAPVEKFPVLGSEEKECPVEKLLDMTHTFEENTQDGRINNENTQDNIVINNDNMQHCHINNKDIQDSHPYKENTQQRRASEIRKRQISYYSVIEII